MELLTPNTIAELICFIIAFIFLIGDRSRTYKAIIFYLFLMCTVELIGIYIRKDLHLPNSWIYNILIVAECFTVSYIFYRLFKPYGLKLKWLGPWLALFIAIYVVELLSNGYSIFVSNSTAVMSVVFVVSSLYYYYFKLKDEEHEELLTVPAFWWVSGTFFFYFGSTACNVFEKYLSQNEIVTFNHSIRYNVFIVLNIILYSFWSIAFICRYYQRKLSASLG